MGLQFDAIDRVFKNATEVMEKSRHQIFKIGESARSEWETLSKELEAVTEQTNRMIDLVDKLELEYRRARIRLTEVSRDFKRFKEEDIKVAYEAATHLQLQLSIHREKETHLKARRDDLQKRLRNLENMIERAETAVSQMNVVLDYLSGDLNHIPRILESAKSRQLLGFKIILAQEEERRRIAREVHDGPAQSMANAVLRSEIAERMLMKHDYAMAQKELRDLKAQVREGLEEVRKIISNLRPMALDDLGLIPALRKYVQDFEERTGIRTKFDMIGKEQRLPSAMEVSIFRLVQEAFSNAHKHANASFLLLEVAFQKQSVKISVLDNGVGFDTDDIDTIMNSGIHFGLMGMRERVELLEGRLEIRSRQGEGTRITMHIPVNKSRRETNGNDNGFRE